MAANTCCILYKAIEGHPGLFVYLHPIGHVHNKVPQEVRLATTKNISIITFNVDIPLPKTCLGYGISTLNVMIGIFFVLEVASIIAKE